MNTEEYPIVYKRLRYIVPFYLHHTDIRKIENTLLAKGWFSEERNDECDLYDYVFQNTTAADPHSIGFSLHRHEDLKIDFCNYRNMKAAFRISETGIRLFRTDVGFYWYEILIDSINDHEIPSAQELIDFQYSIKELNGFTYRTAGMKKTNGIHMTCSGSDFLLADWAENILNEMNTAHCYFARKKRNETDYADRALIFGYASLGNNPSENDIADVCWHIASGNSASMSMPTNAPADMYIPADGQYWKAAREGCFYCLKYSTDNDSFQRKILYQRIVNNYFPIYLLLLHQSYSALLYTMRVEEELDADASIYEKGSQEIYQKLTSLQVEINTFLAKGVYTSVSHVEIINRFYEYTQKALKIEDDIRSLNTGMNALAALQENQLNIQEEKNDKSLQTAMLVFSIMAVFSALIDFTSLVKSFANNQERASLNWNSPWVYIYIGGYAFIGFLLIYFFRKYSQYKNR